jgi:hypothetical protein
MRECRWAILFTERREVDSRFCIDSMIVFVHFASAIRAGLEELHTNYYPSVLDTRGGREDYLESWYALCANRSSFLMLEPHSANVSMTLSIVPVVHPGTRNLSLAR